MSAKEEHRYTIRFNGRYWEAIRHPLGEYTTYKQAQKAARRANEPPRATRLRRLWEELDR